MEDNKKVIKIVKRPIGPQEYIDPYYFSGVDIDENGNAVICSTQNVWKALHFPTWNLDMAKSWCDFIKKMKGKRYEVSIITIKLKY